MVNIAASTSVKSPLLADSRFSVQEFRRRWSAARISALRSVLAGNVFASQRNEENLLLAAVLPEQRDEVLKAVFDFSRKLGVSLSRHLGLSLEVDDFAKLLPLVEAPCFSAAWKNHNDAIVATRSICEAGKSLGALGCDYWREALDGLIMGASDEVRLARHLSAGHGDPECIDVLFADAGTGPQPGKHHGGIPATFTQGLQVLTRQFAERGITLQWEGYSEGVLFYRVKAGANPLCGTGGQLIHDALKEEVQKFFSGIEARDGSPLAVIGDAK